MSSGPEETVPCNVPGVLTLRSHTSSLKLVNTICHYGIHLSQQTFGFAVVFLVDESFHCEVEPAMQVRQFIAGFHRVILTRRMRAPSSTFHSEPRFSLQLHSEG